ncbi:hypothetical protein COY05_01535 [Candidatus Peregrinibacteria bacterium CG_4_10_14_0_2_um_filter_38_24]|nr:MAG: hypothetical protein COY05_01535 [Candidatus Peregrinibacteria bacterium CG_4_10_14_0_2_um_filter_38_24]
MFKFKFFVLAVIVPVLFSACSFSFSLGDSEGEKDLGDKVVETEVAQRPEVKEEEAKPIAEVKNYQVEVNSVLVDNTGIGFNYEGEMVSDRDFSTAWCSEKGLGGKISYVFSTPVKASGFGIVPGFARDEAIFKQNNRVHGMQMYFDDVKGNVVTLEDKYGMQFVDFDGEKTFKKITLEVEELYSGSKYDDTCISEWDFVSDYVQNKDAVAAKGYYENYKKKDALKPYDIVGEISVSDVTTSACNNPEKASGLVLEENGVKKYPGWKRLYVAANVNEFGSISDVVDLELYYKGWDGQWYISDSALSSPVVKACNGGLYSNFEVYTGYYDSEYLMKFYNKGKLVGSKEIVVYY